jgi:hypothetical protein
MKVRELLVGFCAIALLGTLVDAAQTSSQRVPDADSPTGAAGEDISDADIPTYANFRGQTIMNNDRLVVQRFVIPAGQWVGRHTAIGNQLWVQMNDGVWQQHDDPTKLLKQTAGTVGWIEKAENDDGAINAGMTPIEVLWVTLKPHTASAEDIAKMKNYRLVYPNIPGLVLIENDQVVVQRFVVWPGEWEGPHYHPGNQLYIHIHKEGAIWDVLQAGKDSNSERAGRMPRVPRAVSLAESFGIGMEPAIPPSEYHQSGNVGTAPFDLMWVTLKR